MRKLILIAISVVLLLGLYGGYSTLTSLAGEGEVKNLISQLEEEIKEDLLSEENTKNNQDKTQPKKNTELRNESERTEKLTENPEETVKADAKPTAEKGIENVKNYVFYDITGTSDKLSTNSWESLKNWRTEIKDWAQENPETVILNGQTEEKRVSLTFDDGPDSSVTPKVIDILNEYNVTGNFFFTGENVEAYSRIAKKAYDDEHLVLGHSYNHPDFTAKSKTFIDLDFRKTNVAIKDAIGKTPAMMRPPYGVVTDNVLQVAKGENQQVIIWSTDSLDWSQEKPDNITENVLDNVRPGEIVLMHSIGSNEATAEALPDIIEGLQDKGFEIVGLDELLGVEAYR